MHHSTTILSMHPDLAKHDKRCHSASTTSTLYSWPLTPSPSPRAGRGEPERLVAVEAALRLYPMPIEQLHVLRQAVINFASD